MTSRTDIKIEVLGELVVRRRDGTVVGHDEWRTGQTRDLLRLLALSNGRRLRRSSIAEQLWPHVAPERARASLRTAGSQIRRAIGSDCLIRHGDGTTRGWTLRRVESLPDRRSRLYVREEPGFLIEGDDRAARYYQFPGITAPGPHTFTIATLGRTPARPL